MNRRALISVTICLAGLAGCHRRTHPDDGASTPAPAPTTPAQPSRSASPSAGAWQGATCEDPCCGGAVCKVTSANSERPGCKAGSLYCDRCPSRLTCIPGACTTLLAPGETWEIHASYVAGGTIHNDCQPPYIAAAACLRPTGTVDWTCLSIAEACAHEGRSEQSLAVTTDDLVTRGLDIEVRDGGAGGQVIARRYGARYAHGVTRRALCSGLKFDELVSSTGSPIDTFAYILEPR